LARVDLIEEPAGAELPRPYRWTMGWRGSREAVVALIWRLRRETHPSLG